MAEKDRYYPFPKMMCPISGDMIESWERIDDDSVGTEWYEKDPKAR